MERPENCPEKLYRLMCRTWQHRPSSRPTFLQIVSLLLDDAAPSFRKVSFYHTQEAQELLQHPQSRSSGFLRKKKTKKQFPISQYPVFSLAFPYAS